MDGRSPGRVGGCLRARSGERDGADSGGRREPHSDRGKPTGRRRGDSCSAAGACRPTGGRSPDRRRCPSALRDGLLRQRDGHARSHGWRVGSYVPRRRTPVDSRSSHLGQQKDRRRRVGGGSQDPSEYDLGPGEGPQGHHRGEEALREEGLSRCDHRAATRRPRREPSHARFRHQRERADPHRRAPPRRRASLLAVASQERSADEREVVSLVPHGCGQSGLRDPRGRYAAPGRVLLRARLHRREGRPAGRRAARRRSLRHDQDRRGTAVQRRRGHDRRRPDLGHAACARGAIARGGGRLPRQQAARRHQRAHRSLWRRRVCVRQRQPGHAGRRRQQDRRRFVLRQQGTDRRYRSTSRRPRSGPSCGAASCVCSEPASSRTSTSRPASRTRKTSSI